MLKSKSYQRRIFIYFFSAFLVFTLVVLGFQYSREKNYRTGQLEQRLSDVASATSKYVEHYQMMEQNDFRPMNEILLLLPTPEMRVTVIDAQGTVVYDSFVADWTKMENHNDRPELQKAKKTGAGANIRHSETTNQDFYYYAANFGEYYVRCAMVYDVKLQHFLKASRIFILFTIFMLAVMYAMLHLLTTQLGDFTRRLRDFVLKASRGEEIISEIDDEDGEFGEIQYQIMHIYNELTQSKEELSTEKERLFNHLHALNEGIAFFTPQREKILANAHFVQYANLISSRSNIAMDSVLEIEALKPILKKISKVLKSEKAINPKKLPHFEMTVGGSNELYFKVQGIVFQDKSFEILIEDITRLEKRRLLKQQLTSNIAHELKTPLASIKGYLETILNNHAVIPTDKQIYFVERAFAQTERLNVLLNDISLINNMEDAAELFEMKQVKIRPLINDVMENLESRIQQHHILVKIDVSDSVSIYGNDSLLTSIFQNFMENTMKYAGDNSEAVIKQYTEDEKFYYFSFSNTGKPIPEEHLARIFERFYRIDEGRTRDAGGTGLGLSIVKNAVQLHKGDISVRNRPDGGVVFLFSLAKH
ncbi:MAG: ATP-binding protein [Mangrovibacterium sp.]